MLMFCKLFAQPTKKQIDSLFALTLNQNNKIALSTSYLNLANAYVLSGTNIKKGLNFSEKGYDIATEINFTRGIATYYLLKSKIAYYNGVKKKSEFYSKKAMLTFNSAKDKKGYLEAAYFHTLSLNSDYDYNKAIKFAIQIIRDNPNFAKTKEISQLYFTIGILYSRSNQQDLALQYLNKALSIFKINRNKAEIALCYNEFGLLYLVNGQFNNAIEYCGRALQISKNTEISAYSKALILSFLSEAYSSIKVYDKSLIYNQKSLKIFKEYESEDNITNCLNGIAINYYYQGDYSKAKKVCFEIVTKHKESEFKIDAILLLGNLYQDEKDYNNALKNYYLVLEELSKYPDMSIEQENYRWVYENLAFTYKALGNYKKALEYQEIFTTINSRVFQKEKDKRINELQVKFNSNEKDIALKKLTIEKQKKELELQKQSQITFIITVLLLFLIPSLFILYFYYSSKKKLSQKLAKKNDDLLVSQSKIQATLNEKNLLLKEIHHRVKNNLQLVMSLLNIQARNDVSLSIEDFIEKSQSRIASMVLIHENLYQKEDIGNIDFQTYLQKLTQNVTESFGEQSNNISVEVEAVNIHFDIQTAIPLGLIINELLTNAFKHAFPNTNNGIISITISKDETNNIYTIVIRDNGVGLPLYAFDKKSFGLELVSLLVLQLGGNMKHEIKNGTQYTFTFKEA